MSVHPNKAEIGKFVCALFKHADPDTFVSLRSFPQQAGRGEARIHPVRAKIKAVIDAAFAEACLDARQNEARVFCPPVATFGNNRKANEQSLAQGLVIAVDLDRLPKKGLARLMKLLGAPTLVVATGGIAKTEQGRERRLHAYWRLRKPARTAAEHARLKAVQSMAAQIGLSDKTAVPIVHPLRWAGTVHAKGKPRLATVIAINADREVELQRAYKVLRKAAPQHNAAVRKTSCAKKAIKGRGARDPGSQSMAALVKQVVKAKSYHGALMQLAMRHARHGMAQAAIIETLQGLMLSVPNSARTSSEQQQRWNDRFAEIPRLVASAVEKLESEASWPEPEPLPSVRPAVPEMTADMLPMRLRRWITAAATTMQLPLDFIAIPALVAAGAAVGRRLAIQPKQHEQGWVEAPNLWGCVVGSPAAMKSPAASVGLAPLQALEAGARARNKLALERHERALRDYKARTEALKQRFKKELASDPDAKFSDLVGDPPTPPKLQRHIINDATPEQLGAIHADNPDGLLVHRDELLPFLLRLDRDDKAEERGLYLSAWSGLEGYAWDRVGRGHLGLTALCLSVFGTTQPDRIVPYIQKVKGAGDGLIQRFSLFTWPDMPRDWRNVDEGLDQAVLDRARATFRRLTRIDAAKLAHATLSPKGVYVLKFGPKAQRHFAQWHGVLERRLRRDALPPIIEAHLGKYRSLVPSLALLFHLIDGGEGLVSLEAVKRATRWAAYLEAHAFRVYGTVLRTDVLGAETLLSHIKKGDLARTFSARDVQRPSWRNLTDRKSIEAALSVLMDCQIVRRRVLTVKAKKSTVYDVNPRVLKAKETERGA